ncbi:MAG: TonB-dependent receptor [Burkholderiales bacterium]|nr:TonB-dependent receptor [Burkholderiales bacterium]
MNAPLNVGQAHASGIELEAKFPLRELFAYAPALDFRGNFSRFWSRVDGIQGSNNRLDQQPTMTANIGLDYRPQGAVIQFGGNFNWTPSFENQSSDSQTSFTGIKRQLDAYVLWKLNSQTKLRLAASNLFANEAVSANSLELNRVVYLQSNRAQTYRVLNLRLEMRW